MVILLCVLDVVVELQKVGSAQCRVYAERARYFVTSLLFAICQSSFFKEDALLKVVQNLLTKTKVLKDVVAELLELVIVSSKRLGSLGSLWLYLSRVDDVFDHRLCFLVLLRCGLILLAAFRNLLFFF